MKEEFRLHSIVEGHVQGVGFRMFVLETARFLDLSGWVRNTLDGNVEVLAEGPRDSLVKLLDMLRKGPRSAFVTSVSQDWSPASGEFSEFSVTRTG